MSEELRERVRERYAAAARGVSGEGGSEEGCCDSSCCGTGSEAQKVDLTGGSYSEEEKGAIPEEAVGASLGCGNPTALATLSRLRAHRKFLERLAASHEPVRE